MSDKITEGHRTVFEVLASCIELETCAIMLCKELETGNNVPVLVAVNETEEAFEFYPLGTIFEDIQSAFDKYEPLLPDVETEDKTDEETATAD